jgi:transcriptional regulator with XRE-family HTH domain
MIRIEFSEQDLKKIQQLRYAHPHPRVRRRMEVLWLKSQGLAHREICRLAGISSNTLRQYLGMFQSGGIKKLTELNFYAPTSELEQHRYRLEVHFRKHPPASINEAATMIEELTESSAVRAPWGGFSIRSAWLREESEPYPRKPIRRSKSIFASIS